MVVENRIADRGRDGKPRYKTRKTPVPRKQATSLPALPVIGNAELEAAEQFGFKCGHQGRNHIRLSYSEPGAYIAFYVGWLRGAAERRTELRRNAADPSCLGALDWDSQPARQRAAVWLEAHPEVASHG